MSEFEPASGAVHPFSWGKPQDSRVPDFLTSQQVEGFGEGLSSPDGFALLAAARFWWVPEGHQWRSPRDHRGTHALVDMKAPQQNFVEWRTASAPAAAEATFTFVGGSAALLAHTYPDPQARLLIDGQHALTFPLGRHLAFRVNGADAALEFTPLRYIAPVENSIHRQGLEVGNVSGLYRLNLPAALVRADEPVTLRVELEPVPGDVTAWFYVQPRRDALALSIQTLGQEVRRLQADLIGLKETVDRLGRRIYPEIHTENIPVERFIVTIDPQRHVHPPNLTLLRNGELLATWREGSEHVSDDSRGVMLRSRDGGRTWGERVVLYEYPYTDLRQCPITELHDGTLLSTVLLDHNYTADRLGMYADGIHPGYRGQLPSIYILRSTDGGAGWQQIAGPIATPNHVLEVSKQMVQLPGGRLLMATAFLDIGGTNTLRSQVLASDDSGLTWWQHGTTPPVEAPITGEPALARLPSGRLVKLLRTEMETDGAYYQSDSEDDGATWTQPRRVPLPSMSAPAHLLTLRDGRLLCTYGTRLDPRSIYVCLSHDEGRTWDIANRRVLADDIANLDATYPSTVELPSGEFVTLYYDCLFGRYAILGCRYRF